MFEKKEGRWNIEEGIDELRNWEGKEDERKGERRAKEEVKGRKGKRKGRIRGKQERKNVIN